MRRVSGLQVRLISRCACASRSGQFLKIGIELARHGLELAYVFERECGRVYACDAAGNAWSHPNVYGSGLARSFDDSVY